MSIDLMVRCGCWERGLCTPCPLPVEETDPDEERGYPGLALSQDAESRRLMREWHETCCPHGGWALIERFSSTVHTGRDRDAAAAAGLDVPVLARVLDTIHGIGLGGLEPDECAHLAAEIDRVLAAGAAEADDLALSRLDLLRRAAALSIEHRQPLIWS